MAMTDSDRRPSYILNLPMIGLWVPLCSVPYHLLYPAILVFCAIGVFTVNNREFDVYLMALFGVPGHVFSKLACEPAPMMLGFILGPMMEEYLRRALLPAPLARRSDRPAHAADQRRHPGRQRARNDRRAQPGHQQQTPRGLRGGVTQPSFE
jgi:hypothetical protein